MHIWSKLWAEACQQALRENAYCVVKLMPNKRQFLLQATWVWAQVTEDMGGGKPIVHKVLGICLASNIQQVSSLAKSKI